MSTTSNSTASLRPEQPGASIDMRSLLLSRLSFSPTAPLHLHSRHCDTTMLLCAALFVIPRFRQSHHTQTHTTAWVRSRKKSRTTNHIFMSNLCKRWAHTHGMPFNSHLCPFLVGCFVVRTGVGSVERTTLCHNNQKTKVSWPRTKAKSFIVIYGVRWKIALATAYISLSMGFWLL